MRVVQAADAAANAYQGYQHTLAAAEAFESGDRLGGSLHLVGALLGNAHLGVRGLQGAARLGYDVRIDPNRLTAGGLGAFGVRTREGTAVSPVELTTERLFEMRRRLRGGAAAVLGPNSFYRIDDQTFATDHLGRLRSTTFSISAANLRQGGRVATSADTTAIGALGLRADVGFHLRGDQFGGSRFYPNLVPGSGGLNSYPTGAFGELESIWKQAAFAGHRVDVTIGLSYGRWRVRPTRFDIVTSISGVELPVIRLVNNSTANIPAHVLNQLRGLVY